MYILLSKCNNAAQFEGGHNEWCKVLEISKLLLFVFAFLSITSCISPKAQINVALIAGEPLNVRCDENEPAENEIWITSRLLAENKRAHIFFVSRKRALELFTEGQVDYVMSGHASIWPEKFNAYLKEMKSAKGVLLFKDNTAVDIESKEDLFSSKLKVGLIRDSVYEKEVVQNVSSISLIF